jgi:hypothetical protein
MNLPRTRAKGERSRKFDFVLFGETDFTGKLVAEYVARHHGLTNDRSGFLFIRRMRPRR